jgi:hypothetical protein
MLHFGAGVKAVHLLEVKDLYSATVSRVNVI